MPIIETKTICASCRHEWAGVGSPGQCPVCGEISFAISVPARADAIAPDGARRPRGRPRKAGARK